MSLLVRAGRRHLLRRPLLAASSILGIALGVAIAVAIDLANASALRAFDLANDTLNGRTTHHIIGGSKGLDEAIYTRLVVERGLSPTAPVVEGWVSARISSTPPSTSPSTVPSTPSSTTESTEPSVVTLRILGIDPFAEAPFRRALSAGAGDDERNRTAFGTGLTGLVSHPRGAVLSRQTAAELGLDDSARFSVQYAGRDHPLESIATIDPVDDRAREALRGVVIVDLATAQELLGRVGFLDRIDLLIPADDDQASTLAEIRDWLPEAAEILPAAARSQTQAQMTEAFRLNLKALSLLALVCGVFLIYNTMTFSVVQRRALIGALRAIGVTRRQVLAMVLSEAAIIGALGTALGLGLGIALADGLLQLVTRSINDLYFVTTVRDLVVPPRLIVQGIILGIGATLLAALPSALEAASAPPRAALRRSTLEARWRRLLPRTTLAGLVTIAVAAVVLSLSGRHLAAGFGGLLAIIVGCALLAPIATVGLMRVLRYPIGALFGVTGRMAARGVVAALSRTAVAVAALVIAVSVTIGIGVMITSFRGTLVNWLDLVLQADVFVRPPAPRNAPGSGEVDPEVIAALTADPDVEWLNHLQVTTIETAEGQQRVLGFDDNPRSRPSFSFVDGDTEDVWKSFESSEAGAVLLTEPFARRRNLERGDRIRLRTDRGLRDLEIAGVFHDYASDQGAIWIERDTYNRLFDQQEIAGVSLFVRPEADLDQVISRLRRTTGPLQELEMTANATLRRRSLEIFDQTFQITSVLRLLAGLVAFVGVLSALSALQIERAREIGVLRATGMTPRQVWALVTTQTGLMGVAAGLFAAPVGIALAVLMIEVINRRLFGWSLTLTVPPSILWEALLLAIVASLLAGLWPAHKMASTSPSEALRAE